MSFLYTVCVAPTHTHTQQQDDAACKGLIISCGVSLSLNNAPVLNNSALMLAVLHVGISVFQKHICMIKIIHIRCLIKERRIENGGKEFSTALKRFEVRNVCFFHFCTHVGSESH